MKGQLVGPLEFRGMNLTEGEFEYLLGKTGAIDTDIKDDPKPKVQEITNSISSLGKLSKKEIKQQNNFQKVFECVWKT